MAINIDRRILTEIERYFIIKLNNTVMRNSEGYLSNLYSFPTKRYCQTLQLRNDSEMIAEYVKRHSESEAWPEIRRGIREVGILEMEIYIKDNLLFMIVETPLDFDWNSAMKCLSTLPRQAEWEAYMALLQGADPQATSDEKWQLMDQISHLYKP